MENKMLLKSVFLLLFLMPVSLVSAQSVTGVKSYKKASVVSSSEECVVVEAKALDSKVGVKESVQKSAAVSKEAKVDSLSYVAKTYRLGERVIMPGDSGRDVRSMAKILVNKIYIDESELKYTADGGVVYEGRLVKAVKHFQEFNGLHVDGIVGQEVVKALRKRK